MTPVETLISYFESGAFPNSEQFKELIQSIWHKSERMPIEQVETLVDRLNVLLETETFNSTVQDLVSNISVKLEKGTYIGTADDLHREIQTVLDGAGKTYTTIAEAMAVNPLPSDNTPFRIKNNPVSNDDGDYIYLSTEANGYKFFANSIAQTIDANNTTHPVSGRSVWYEKELLNKKFSHIGLVVDLLPYELDNGEVNSATGNGNSSLNWLNSGLIDVSENTQYTTGGYAMTTAAANKRITFVDGSGNVISILGSGTDKDFTFTTPAGTAKLNIQIEALVGSGTDPENSIYNNSFYIVKGLELPSLKGEKIQGVISTPQIASIEGFKNSLEPYVSYTDNALTSALANGAININGVVTSTIGYKRTSVTNNTAMFPYLGGSYIYTGEIQDVGLAGVAYFDDNLDFISSEVTIIQVYDKYALNVPQNCKYIAACSYNGNPIVEQRIPSLNSASTKNIYVDANAIDGGNGSINSPFNTISDAFNSLSIGTKNTIIINEGDYRETLPFANLGNTEIELIGLESKKVRVLGSVKLENWTYVSGNTYKCSFNGNIPNWGRYDDPIFEDFNPSKAINYNQRHPLQKGLSNRLPFTQIKQSADLVSVENTPGRYFYDEANNELYIHTTNSDNPNTNGFSYEMPQRALNTYNAHDEKQRTNIKIINMQFMFASSGLRFEGFNFIERYYCTVLACAGSGAFRDDSGTLIRSWYDEAGFCDNDGINGHFAVYTGYQDLTDHRSMQPTAIYHEPWCHDNHDDGMSHHENHNVKVNGGLFEYNGDGGIRASNDANYVINNIHSRNNGWDLNNTDAAGGEGIAAVNPTSNQNRNGCKVVARNCVFEDNNCGVSSISQSDNVVELINCITRNNNKELYVSNGAKIISRNTKATNADSSKLKVINGTGIIEVLNDNILS